MALDNVRTEYFICYRGKDRLGGAIAGKIHETIHGKYGKPAFFALSDKRLYCGEYRNDEAVALEEMRHFVVIFTNDLIDQLTEGDEVLFELRTALARKEEVSVYAIADPQFCWNEERKALVKRLFSAEDADRLIYLDYIPYFGGREYRVTESRLADVLALPYVKTELVGMENWVKKLLAHQKRDLNGNFSSSSIDQVLKRYGADSLYTPETLVNGKKKAFSLPLLKNGSNITFLIGPSGSGKSFYLRTMYEAACAEFASDKDAMFLPLFLEMNGETTFNCDRTAMLSFLADKYALALSDELAEDLVSRYRMIFFIDGLDECSTTLHASMIENGLQCRSEEDLYFISCRAGFFRNLGLKNVDAVVDILPVSEKKLLARCKSILKKRKFSAEQSEKLLDFAKEHQTLFSNILMLNLFLLYAEEDLLQQGAQELSKAAVLDLLLEKVIVRDIEKKQCALTLEQAEDVLQEIALETLLQRNCVVRSDHSKMMTRVCAHFSELPIPEVYKLAELFVKEGCLGDYRFIHESYYEFFLACKLVNDLYAQEDCSEILEYGLSLETNRFITELFFLRGREKAFDALTALYRKSDSQAYAKRLQILNHLHRTALYFKIKTFVLEELAREEDETSRFLLLHSLEVVGDEKAEEEYYAYLKKDQRHALLNSGITLLYYHNISNLSLPYYDDGTLSLRPVFMGYCKHFTEGNAVPHYRRVWRINLFTLRTMLAQRQTVESEIVHFFEGMEEQFLQDDSLFGQKVLAEYRTLMEDLEKKRKV